MKKFLTVALAGVLAASMLFTGCSKKEESKVPDKLIVGTNAEFPPFEYMNDKKQPDGFDIAMIKEIGKRMDKKVEIQNMEFKSLIGAMESESINTVIAGMTKTAEREESVDFSDRFFDALCRRDFTINAMAYNDTDGFVDEFKGLDDLDTKIIRCVGEPELRFTEDALRMMRAIRFSAQLGFTIDEATWNAIKKLSPSISKISMERVHVELGKTLMSAHPDYVAQYSEAGLFAPILPVIDNALKSRYKRKILATLQHTPDNIYLRYAALFITSTPDEAAKTLRALKLDNKTVNTVSKLVELSKMDIEETEPAVRTALNKYGRDFLPLWHELMMAVIQASEDITGISNPAKVKHLLTLKRLVTDILARGDCFTIKALDISGNDLIEYGLQGHEIGETLKSLLDIVIENPKLNDKATLIAMIEHIK